VVSESVPGRLRVISGSAPGNFRVGSGWFPGRLRIISGSAPGGFRMLRMMIVCSKDRFILGYKRLPKGRELKRRVVS
jgi:hypothetical protein